MKITPDGWYSAPADPPTVERYWQNGFWTPHTRVQSSSKRVLEGAVVMATLAGMLLTFLTPVSLMTGMGVVIVGVVLAVAGTVMAAVLRVSTPIIIACACLATLAVLAGMYDYYQLAQLSQEIQDVFNQ